MLSVIPLLFCTLLLLLGLFHSDAMKLVVATRLHLGKAEAPPTDLEAKIQNFTHFCEESCQAQVGLLIVESTPRIEGYDLVAAVQKACDTHAAPDANCRFHVLPVTPYYKFATPLNVAVGYAVGECQADRILFVSAETNAPRAAIQQLLQAVSPQDCLLAGAALPGHDYEPGQHALGGRTCPWNTLSVWKARTLALTGFQLVSDGHLTEEPSYGIEEVVAAALLQKLHPPSTVKLIQLEGVEWNQDFSDPERKKWHEEKMQSKTIRARRQMELMGLSGVVEHC